MSQPKSVLVVDDSALSLTMTREALVEAGFDVVTAANLAEVEQVAATGVDLILMDVEMPEAFGDDLGHVLKRARGVEAPIWLWSTLPKEELETMVKDAGLDGYLSKQDGVENMVERVRGLLG